MKLEIQAFIKRVIRRDYKQEPVDMSGGHRYARRPYSITDISYAFTSRIWVLGQVRKYRPYGVVDLGCGVHQELLQNMRSSRMYQPYVGADALPPEKSAKNAFTVHADLTGQWPFRDGRVPMFVASEFFEHLSREDALTVLMRTYRSLEKGGTLVVIMPLETDPPRDVERDLKRYGHQHYWEEEEWADAVGTLGFKTISTVRARFFGDSIRVKQLRHGAFVRYGDGGVDLVDDLVNRYGTTVAGYIMAHVYPEYGSNLEAVYTK